MLYLIMTLTLLFSFSFYPLGSKASADPISRDETLNMPNEIVIPYQETMISAGPLMSRNVQFQVPVGNPPPQGWPVVIMFQGTKQPVEFSRSRDAEYGFIYEVYLIKILLENGYAVLAPRAIFNYGWVTNIAQIGYRFTSDYFFIDNILNEIKNGHFGHLDFKKVYATGISSGGYNTSRMAVSFPGRFRALAIHSGSYATCLAELCRVPKNLPKDHPPTLLLYGDKDGSVPRWSVENYFDSLLKNNISTQFYSDSECGHEWCKNSPIKILNWFNKFN